MKKNMKIVKFLILELLVKCASGFNLTLSSADKDELWGALLRGEIGHNYSTALPVLPKRSDGASVADDITAADYENGDYYYGDYRLSASDEVRDLYDGGGNYVNETNRKSAGHSSTVNQKTNDSSLKNLNGSKNENKKFLKDNRLNDDVKMKYKREHGDLQMDDKMLIDQGYQVIAANDFDNFIPNLMNLNNSDSITIIENENGGKLIKDMTKVERKKLTKPKPGQTSLVIVFDGTGSMENCLIQLRSGAKQIIEKFADRDDNPIFNYIFVPFRDPHIGPELVTTDQNELLETLESMRLWGGGDCPESALNGILASLKYALPRSYVYIFTDAIAKDFALDNDVLTMIQKKQTSLTFLLTGFCKSKDSPGYEVFEKLAAASNGQVYNLQTQDIKDVLEDIKDTLDTRRVALKYLDSPGADSHNIDVTIDENLKEFSVSVAGHNPNITVVDPLKNRFDNGEERLNLENLKVVNVQNPMPGEWNVKAESDSPHSIRLTALSDVVFNFGFSLKIPNHIEETLFNPLLGEDNILSISPSNSTGLRNLTNVQISLYYDKNDNQMDQIKFNLPLRKIAKLNSNDNGLYVTEPFQPPRQQFKIDIEGFDENGNPLKRLLSTVLQSTEESPPDLFVEPDFVEIDELEDFLLKCHVQSAVPVTILWKRNNKIIAEKESDQTTSLDYKVTLADPSHAGLYTCYAVNKKGYTEIKVEVKVNLLPLVVTIPQDVYEILENEIAFIPCNVSRQTYDVQWIFNDSVIEDGPIFESRDSHLIIRKANKKHAGVFTCIARTLSEMKFDSTMLKVMYSPEMDGQFVKEIYTEYHSPLEIPCNVQGEPYPNKNWTFRSKFKPDTEEIMFEENIEIEDFMPENEGIYICEANNGIGNSLMLEINVIGVAGDIPVIELRNQTKISVPKGENVQIPCICHLCKPLTLFSWNWNQKEFSKINETFENVQLTRLDILDKRLENKVEYLLQIQNISEQNGGFYQCKLGNEYGFDELTIEIEVLDKPVIEDISISNDTHKNINPIYEGTSIYLECKAKGSPLPILEWYKNIVSEEHRIHTNTNGIVFDEVKASDEGLYICRAMNKIGVSELNVELQVIAPPTVPSHYLVVTQTAVEGDSLTIKCPAYGRPSPTFKWTFNGNDLPIHNEKYDLANQSLSFISDGTDSGIYECIASNPYGTTSLQTMVLVYVKPKIIPESDEIVEVKVGANITLKCDATGYPIPKVTWTNNGGIIDNTSKYWLSENELNLNNVGITDEGAYVCDAINNIGMVQKIYFIVVNEPPSITSIFPDEVSLIADESISFQCQAIGNPIPNIIWMHGDIEVDAYTTINNMLTVYGNNPEKSGTYVCLAKNQHGVDEKKIQVNIIVPPVVLDTANALKIVSISMGADLELICPFTNYNRITWTKDNKSMLHLSNRHHPSHATILSVEGPRQNNLYFPYVVPELAGNYTCFVENEAGQGNFTIQLNILSPPQILDNDDYIANDILAAPDAKTIEMTVKSGGRFHLECLASGNPAPMIEWKRNNEVISTNKHLKVDHATIGDSGVYKCVASNSEGVTEKEYSIDIITKPTYGRDLDQYFEVNKGDNVTLDCTMHGNPPPQMSWTKDDQPFNEYQEVLEIFPINVSDSGVYRCSGQNKLGYENVTFHVLVFELPSINYINDNTTYMHPEPLKLTCNANGSPIPILSWTYNGQLLISTARIHFTHNSPDARNKSIFIDEYGNGISFPFGIEYVGAAGDNSGKFSNSHHHIDNDNNNNNTIWNSSGIEYSKVNATSSGRYGIAKYIQMPDNAITAAIELILPPETKHHSGRFTCVAINAVGKDEKHTFAKRIVPPAIQNDNPHRLSPSSVEVLDGLPIILKCYLTGLPTPNLYWFKDNRELQDDGRNIRILDSGKLINILQSSIEDNGIYSCIAKNIAGERKIEYNVTVLVPPKIRFNSTSLYEGGDIIEKVIAKQGDHLQLHCPVVGNPIPNIVWIRLLYDDGNDEEILSGNSTDLDIHSIASSSSYVCYANSTFGEVKLVFHINVHKSPQLETTADDQLHNVKLGHSFTLNCAANGDPEPNITWYRNEEIISNFDDSTNLQSEIINSNLYISTDGQYLRVFTASKMDSGRYVCKAHNILGMVKKIFNVMVYAPVHWSPFGFWSSCSTTCGNGVRKRSRMCLQSNGRIADGEDQCVGESVQIQKCQITPCPINGGWSTWTEWSPCSLSCIEENSNIESIRERRRHCDSPEPNLGGKPCAGSDRQEEICSVPYCPVDGGWSSWSDWTPCSATCGTGTKIRYRKCNNPAAVHGGAYCDGANVESTNCYVTSCAIHGGWSDWSPWSPCSKTCGRGQKYRKRECTNPTPMNGGNLCEGAKFETKMCKVKACRNANLVKSQKIQKSRYTPLMTFPVNAIELSNEEYWDGERNYDYPDTKYEYSEGRPVDYIPPPPFLETHEEVLTKPQKVVIRVENFIPISEDTAQISVNLKSGSSPITLNKPRKCDSGYELREGICQDIDECVSGEHKCSDYCVNVPGSYLCRCSENWELSEDGRHCNPYRSYNQLQQDDPQSKHQQTKEFIKYAEMICPDGYYIENEVCHDTNECQALTDECGEDQTCLNTRGSYLCAPTPCPEDYDRDNFSGQCVQICSKKICTDNAKIAQSISYTVMSLKETDLDIPILKLVSYDIYKRPLVNTDFSFLDHTDGDIFVLERIPHKLGIVYLYAKENIQKEKVYKIKIIGRSYDLNGIQLLYVSRFIVYVYII